MDPGGESGSTTGASTTGASTTGSEAAPRDPGEVEGGAPAPAKVSALAALNPEDFIMEAMSLKVLGPQVVVAGIGPLLCYEIVLHAFHTSDPVALASSALPPAILVVVEWIQKRAVSFVGILVLLGIIGGLFASWVTHGNEFLFKVRQSAPGALFGLCCLGTLIVGKRPMMFYVGRMFTATLDRNAVEEFNTLWDEPQARRTFRVLTAMWGIVLLVEASVTVTLIVTVSTAKFLALNSLTTGSLFLGLLIWTVSYMKAARRKLDLERPDDVEAQPTP